MFGKKSSEKNCEKRFLYSNEYGDKKCGEKHPRNHISRNTRIMRAKNVEKITVEKYEKKRFYIHTTFVTKKWGDRIARNIFSRNTRTVRAKNGKKFVVKKCENVFLFT